MNNPTIDSQPDYESYWQQLRHHIEWTEGFGLFYYFCDDPALILFLQDRMEPFLIGRTTCLQEWVYQPQDNDWIHASLEYLLMRDKDWGKLRSPVWLNLTQSSHKTAYSDYYKLLQRMNERRDLLRKHYHEPIILLFPVSFQEQCRLAAPDLWSIRNFSETIARPPAPLIPTNSHPANQANQPLPSSDYLNQLLKEWHRIKQTESKGEDKLYLAQDTTRELIKYQQLNKAREIIEQGLDIAKVIENQREISVCLDIMGDIAKQQGRGNDAQASFEESLDISRRLAKMLGESPEALRDLSVSLNKVGDIAKQQGRGNDAQASFEESLDIRRRLAKMLGESPQALRDLSVSLNKVGDIAKQQGRGNDAQASFEESLDISRRLAKMLGESPQALRDLSVSLDNVGDIAKQQGRGNDAQASFEESLNISRRLAKMLGESPQALRDLSVSLFKNGQLAVEQMNWQQAKDYLEEGLSIANRLATLLPELPDYSELPSYFSKSLTDLPRKI